MDVRLITMVWRMIDKKNMIPLRKHVVCVVYAIWLEKHR
jgi:hypothetical protein